MFLAQVASTESNPATDKQLCTEKPTIKENSAKILPAHLLLLICITVVTAADVVESGAFVCLLSKNGSDTDLMNQAHVELDENVVCPMLDTGPRVQQCR